MSLSSSGFVLCFRVIADKQHVHMNATKWDTLTTFVKYLGKQGHCLVDETEKVCASSPAVTQPLPQSTTTNHTHRTTSV